MPFSAIGKREEIQKLDEVTEICLIEILACFSLYVWSKKQTVTVQTSYVHLTFYWYVYVPVKSFSLGAYNMESTQISNSCGF